MEEKLPQTIGLCPGEHREFWYMPDAKPGDTCPESYEDHNPELVLYVPAKQQQARIEELEGALPPMNDDERHELNLITARADERIAYWEQVRRTYNGGPENWQPPYHAQRLEVARRARAVLVALSTQPDAPEGENDGS